jgi:hypothetical protein
MNSPQFGRNLVSPAKPTVANTHPIREEMNIAEVGITAE